jgi:hypothetical protein
MGIALDRQRRVAGEGRAEDRTMTTTATHDDRRAREICEQLADELRSHLCRAEEVLRSLESAKRETEETLASANRSDPIKCVTGRSALDRSIEHTAAMIDRLRRAFEEAQRLLRSSGPVSMDAAIRVRRVAFSS